MNKKILWFVIPIGLVAVLLTAHAAQSFGFRHRGSGHMKEFVMFKLDRLGKELNLNDSQTANLDSFKQDLEKIMDQHADKRSQIHSAVKEELSKQDPDLTNITPLINQRIDETAQVAHGLVDRFNQFFSSLTPEQKKTVSEKILEHHCGEESED